MTNLENLISIRSDDDCTKIVEFVKSELKDIAAEIMEIKTANKSKPVLAISIGSQIANSKPIILSGHIDTVPADKTLYKTNPYRLEIIGSKAYGLGVIDMKCFLASILDNIKEISQLGPILICLTCDEETTLNRIEVLIKTLKQLNVQPQFAIIGEPTSLEIKTSAKSCIEYRLEIVGKACHASMPQNGINSIYIASKFASYIEKLSKNLKFTTLNLGTINGGVIINQVPKDCVLAFDIRSSNVKEQNAVLKKLNTKITTLKTQYAPI